MSEEKIEEIHAELSKQVMDTVQERERLFANPEERGFGVPKFRVKEELKDVFPELSKDLQEHGQRVPVFMTKEGIIKDGIKRTLLAENPSELKTEIVDDNAFVENIPLNRKQRNIVIKFAYDNLIKTGKYIHKEVVEKLSKRYGLSARQIENIIYGHEKISSPSAKPKHSKCDNCPYKNQPKEFNLDTDTIIDSMLNILDVEEKPVFNDAEIIKLKTIKVFIDKWFYTT